MAPLQLTLIAVVVAGAMAASENQGPAAFWWPPDRVWAAATDNAPPCGSSNAVGERTKFPLTGGKISITAQDDSHNAFLRISFQNDPKSLSDFARTGPIITEIDPGHTCYAIADPPTGTAPGTNATLQIEYIADFDRPENQTFYACADITYVPASEVNLADKPCFNSTSPENVPAPTATGEPTHLPGHGPDGPPLSTAKPGANKLSKGAIAGIVVGSVIGFALIVGLGLLFYREKKRKNRLVRQRDSARGTGWSAAGGGGNAPRKDSASASAASGGSIRLQSMGSRGQ